MLYPVSRTVFRWSTPDPDANWLMNGHLILSGENAILVDPPNIPCLAEAVARLGKFESVILTTGDHLRGSEYFESEFNARIFLPKQGKNEIDEGATLRISRLKNVTFFSEGDNLPGGIKAFRARVDAGKTAASLDEVMLLTETGELLAGDIAMGSMDGKLLTRNEFFYKSPDPMENAACLKAVGSVIRRSGAITLLSSHGFDILENLQSVLADKINSNQNFQNMKE